MWQPIETQPFDGSLILTYSPGGIVIQPSVEPTTLTDKEKRYLVQKVGLWPNHREFTATHWMPLPAPPEGEYRG